MKTFYILYQITNNLNGKIYVGVHKTKDINDGYMGSGKIIRSAMAKHGITNFSKVILEQFDNSSAMYARETEVVTDEFLLREDTYNLRRGGFGGFEYINKQVESRVEKNKKAREATNKVLETKYGVNWQSIISTKGGKSSHTESAESQRKATRNRNGVKSSSEYMNTPEVNVKRKATFAAIGHQQGSKNSNFGKMWITNEFESKKILKTDTVPEGWRIGRVMRVKC